jgi:two-component system phosphate regulon sensor histidine kinase PhoR
MDSLRVRITAGFIIIIILMLTTLGIYNGKLLESTIIDNIASRLEKEAYLVSKSVDWVSLLSQPDQMSRLIETWSESGEARVTVINLDGRVLGDSEVPYQSMENHINRKEVRAALDEKTGIAIRESSTTGEDMLYVAVPVYHGQELLGVLRLAYSIEQVKGTVHKLWMGQLVAFIVVLILFSFLGSRLAKGLTEPIEKIIEVARNITKQRYGTKVKVKGKGEIADLARAINFMSESLEQQMKQIREEEKRFTDVMKNMVSGVILINQEGRILLVNRAIESILGLNGDEIIGIRHNETTKNFGLSQLIDRVLKEKNRVRNEIHIYYPEEKILDANLAPLFDEEGHFVGVVVVLHDITEIRRLEKIRSDFVANASHELKTPVTSIRGFAETLLDGAMYEEETLQSFLKIIYNESERLQRLIDDILDLTKIEQKRLPLEIRCCSIHDLITELETHLHGELEKKQISFSSQIPEDMKIEADYDRLKQIFINLIANAIQYTPEGGQIEVTATETAANITIHVRDTGIGIPKKDLNRIFERFYRVDKARSRHSGGTGLGLAIVKHLVDSHLGKIWVESEEGKGSIFHVELPKKQTV